MAPSDKKKSKGSSGSRSGHAASSSSNRSVFYGSSGGQPSHNSYSTDQYRSGSNDPYAPYVDRNGNLVGGRNGQAEKDAQRYINDYNKKFRK